MSRAGSDTSIPAAGKGVVSGPKSCSCRSQMLVCSPHQVSLMTGRILSAPCKPNLICNLGVLCGHLDSLK